MEAGEPRVKRSKHSILSEHLHEPEFEKTFSENWKNNTSTITDNLEVIADPFRVCRISNFLKHENLILELKNELLDVKTRRNSTDLYQFEQSSELSHIESFFLHQLAITLQTEMVAWMQKNTNIELNGSISMSSSCYTDTDFLLCHDDNLDDRRIAFILYISDKWTENDGGTLDLINTDENGLPKNVVRSLTPEFNSFVFFEVVHNSYHQVGEVTSDKARWSINGWFHGPLPNIERPARSKIIIPYYEPVYSWINLDSWVSSENLLNHKIVDINKILEKKSWVVIRDFLILQVYEKLSQRVQSKKIKWKKVGPADIRNYEIAEVDSLPTILTDFCKIFKSISFFKLLKKYTCMDLVPEREDMHPRMTMELQRWSKGCYTLLHDELQTTVAETVFVKSEFNNCDPNTAKEDKLNFTNVSRLPTNIDEESGSSGIRDNEPTLDSNTPPCSHDENEFDDDDSHDNLKNELGEKSQTSKTDKKILDSPSKVARRRRVLAVEDDLNRCNSESESDIEDYLSDHEEEDEQVKRKKIIVQDELMEQEEDFDDAEESSAEVDEGPGSLDLILHFNVDKQKQLADDTIDYVDMTQEDRESALCQVPVNDNILSLVYKNSGICSTRKHLSHYFEGYYYTLICNYCE